MLLSYERRAGENVSLRLREVDVGKAITLGRGREAVVRINDDKCSRVHAAIRYWDGIFVLRDMHSNNGTFKNGERIEVCSLQPEDIIQLGETKIYVRKDNSCNEETLVVT